MTLDELRARLPYVGFALYALDPGADVTLEVHANGEVWTFKGATEAEAIAAAFPAPPPTVEESPEPATPTQPSVFD